MLIIDFIFSKLVIRSIMIIWSFLILALLRIFIESMFIFFIKVFLFNFLIFIIYFIIIMILRWIIIPNFFFLLLFWINRSLIAKTLRCWWNELKSLDVLVLLNIWYYILHFINWICLLIWQKIGLALLSLCLFRRICFLRITSKISFFFIFKVLLFQFIMLITWLILLIRACNCIHFILIFSFILTLFTIFIN